MTTEMVADGETQTRRTVTEQMDLKLGLIVASNVASSRKRLLHYQPERTILQQELWMSKRCMKIFPGRSPAQIVYNPDHDSNTWAEALAPHQNADRVTKNID